MSIITAIQRNDRIAKERNWDRTYWFFDIHETMIVPNYTKEVTSIEFYPHAKDVMQILSNRPEICLVLYTCSWPNEIEKYLALFKKHGINFTHVNRNPEVVSASYGCYDDKPYINVLFDDKAGFDPTKDWLILRRYFIAKYRLAPLWVFFGWISDGITKLFNKITKRKKNGK